MIHPAMRTGLRPKRSERVPAKKLVAAFTMPNAAMKVSVEENAVSPNSCFGEQRQDGAFLADHPADQGVDPDEEEELGQVLPQPEAERRGRLRRRRRRAAVIVRSRGLGRCCAASRRGRRRAPSGRRGRRLARTLAAVMARSPWPHMTVTGPSGSGMARTAPSSTWRAPGMCPDCHSSSWRTSSTVAAMASGPTIGDGCGRMTGGGPGVDAAGELAEQVVRGRRSGLGGPGRRGPGRRRGRTRAGCRGRRASRARSRTPAAADRDRSGGMGGGEGVDGAGVDEHRAVGDEASGIVEARVPGGWGWSGSGGVLVGSARGAPGSRWGTTPSGRGAVRRTRPRRSCCSSGLVARSVPMVVVRCDPDGAEQNDPAPWVGYTARSSGRVRMSWCRARNSSAASPSACSSPSRSVRPTVPTISDPPENSATGSPCSTSR